VGSPYRELIDAWARGERSPAPVAELVGFRLESYEGGVARLTMEAAEKHHNPMGIVHGGILCDLADGAMGVAFAASLEEGESFTTLQLQSQFLRPVREGRLVAEARVVHRGRQVGVVDCEIADADGRPVARVTSTCLVLREG